MDCTLENGSETTCYQVEVASLASTVDTDGPYCPQTTSDVGGIWVWDGDQPGLYALDSDFWDMMQAQGYEFVNADGTITVTDPAEGSASSSTTANSCLEATPDGSFHLQVLIPTSPEQLDTPTDLSTVSQVGLALDGVTIFGDAPSVADRGGLPALDACGGHIDPSGYYHWHFGAESIQTNLDEAGADVSCSVDQDAEALIGFAYDGYAVYGPEEDRAIPADLDACSGHISETARLRYRLPLPPELRLPEPADLPSGGHRHRQADQPGQQRRRPPRRRRRWWWTRRRRTTPRCRRLIVARILLGLAIALLLAVTGAPPVSAHGTTGDAIALNVDDRRILARRRSSSPRSVCGTPRVTA